jgi:DNA (cytosine-5)-methyltransferase 1
MEGLFDGDPQPRAIDLFCGCGGMTQGLKAAGYSVVWAVDSAVAPLRTYRSNHPEVDVAQTDIRAVDCDELRESLCLLPKQLDLLAGCPPCQGFSTIRTRNGAGSAEDERNDLIAEFARFVEAFLPLTVMLENVPGLADDERFADFVDRMEQLGYQGSWAVVDAARFGVPQHRRRLIYLAGLETKPAIARSSGGRRTVREAIAHLPTPGSSGDSLHDIPEKRTQRIQELISLIPKDGGSRRDLPAAYVLPCHKRLESGFNDVYGRMAWDKPSPTITGGCASPSKGRFLHPSHDRCITLREAAILQGFPEAYQFETDGVSKGALALMIGNALPVGLIREHASAVLRQLSRPAEESQ